MSTSANARVLVADPDPAISALVMALLRRAGIEADTASDRAAAIMAAAAGSYSAIILEPRMADGDTLLSELYAAAPDGRPNIIIITTPDRATAALSLRAGVVAVLLKPFRLEELYAAVAACCDADADELGPAPRMRAASRG
jgi:DNA-binding response OmpR family regulator